MWFSFEWSKIITRALDSMSALQAAGWRKWRGRRGKDTPQLTLKNDLRKLLPFCLQLISQCLVSGPTYIQWSIRNVVFIQDTKIQRLCYYGGKGHFKGHYRERGISTLEPIQPWRQVDGAWCEAGSVASLDHPA